MRRKDAFTLVELLVVIGIIAVLIAILLPALNSARRQAQTVKCAAQMREVFSCAQLYAGENRGYYPPGRAANYNLGATGYTGGSYVYWYRFLAKYVTQGDPRKVGTPTGSKISVLWCPQFDGYVDPTNQQHTGYGWNVWPTITAAYPAMGVSYPPAVSDTWDPSFNSKEASIVDNTAAAGSPPVWPNPSPNKGTWYKATAYTKPAERALVTDSRVWYTAAQQVGSNGNINGQQVDFSPGPQDVGYYNAGVAHTEVDYYRHGRYPVLANKTTYAAGGGKVAYNILYCDGHVNTITNDRTEAFRSLRMRFPG